jgi:hypothetical protein
MSGVMQDIVLTRSSLWLEVFCMKNDETIQEHQPASEEHDLVSRREYLLSLKKWSKVVIGGVLFGGILTGTSQNADAAAWANRRGGGSGWSNGRGVWVNSRGGWGNGGGSWGNRSGGWGNSGGSWGNRGAGWANRW